MTNTPEISVIMPVYNASKYLAEAIESILNQTFTNFEFIILNDKSTDESLEIIKKYSLIDSRIVIVNQEENIGPALIRNKGFKLAKGNFIALMDADDISYSNRFEKQLDVFKYKTQIGVCGSWFLKFGENITNELIKHYENHIDLKFNFLIECYIGNPTIMLRKNIIDDNLFKTEFVPMEDYELWSRLIDKTHFYNIQEPLLKYRWHDTNISQTTKQNKTKLHNTIRINQLNDFNLNPNINPIHYLNAINFSEKQTSENIEVILKCRRFLIQKNEELKKFDSTIFNNQLNKTSIRTIIKAKNYNLKFLIHILKNERDFFSSINFIDQMKIIFKCFFL